MERMATGPSEHHAVALEVVGAVAADGREGWRFLRRHGLPQHVLAALAASGCPRVRGCAAEVAVEAAAMVGGVALFAPASSLGDAKGSLGERLRHNLSTLSLAPPPLACGGEGSRGRCPPAASRCTAPWAPPCASLRPH